MNAQFPVIDQPSGQQRLKGRIALIGSLLVLMLIVLILSAGRSAQIELASEYAAPGRLIDVGGYSLHLNCLGEGSPTVIMESGLGGFSIFWTLVQPEIARFTQVCVYDRAGYGWSESGPKPRTSERIVGELHTLLENAGVSKPYILVGHSFGGLISRLYTHYYPDDVVGMVLVDAMHEEQDVRLPSYMQAARQLDRQFRWFALLRAIGIVALFPDEVPNPGLPGEAYVRWTAILATTEFFETSNAENLALATSLAEFRATNMSELGSLPLVVISRGLDMPMPGAAAAQTEADEQIWQELQAQLATLSTNSQHLIAEKSGHDIALQQPDLVVESVRQLVSEWQAVDQNSAGEGDIQGSQPEKSDNAVTDAPKAMPTPTQFPTAAPTPTPSPTETPTPAPTVPLNQIEFVLRTEFRDGKMIYVGVGGDIDGIVNPDLIVAPNTLVRATLTIGDGMNHDLYFPDFSAKTDVIGRREQTSEVTFTVNADQIGTFVYYCTLPGHRESGQEGRLIIKQ